MIPSDTTFSKFYKQGILFPHGNFSAYKSNYIFILLLFIFWPFGAFLFSLYQYDKKESHLILILFSALFGFSLIAESHTLDLYRVLNDFTYVTSLHFGDFNEYRASEASVDFYLDIMRFTISRLTSNPSWFMFSLGLVAGIVYVKVLQLFVLENPNRDFHTYALLLSFSMIIGIDQLAGVRMSLAAYVFFYGALKTILIKDYRYLIIASSSSLIHFSFISVILVLFLYIAIKRLPWIIYLILALSFILPGILHSYIQNFSTYLGGGIGARAQLYFEYDPNFHSPDPDWFILFRKNAMMYFFYLVLAIVIFSRKRIRISDKSNSLLLFALLVLSLVNFTFDISSFGERFLSLFLMFSVFLLFLLYSDNKESRLVQNLVLVSLPFSTLMIFYSLRSTLAITPLSLYYYALPGLFFDNSVQSAWTVIKSI